MVMLMIFLTIVLIPKQTSELLRLIQMHSVYAWKVYKSNSEVPFILVTGQFTLENLKIFSNELFHPDHGVQTKNAIIL